MNEGQDYEIYHKPLKYKQGTITMQTAGAVLFICNSVGPVAEAAQAGELGRVTLLPPGPWRSMSQPSLWQHGRAPPAGSS